MSDLKLTEVVARLRRRLAQPLPGLESQLRMAPSQRAEMIAQRKSIAARDAAVLVVLEREDDPRIVLTERRHDLQSHPGQISFPGGRREQNERLLATALREASEEIDLKESDVEIVGELTPLFVPPSNYLVHPFVAYSIRELNLYPADGEVNSIIRARLADLLHPSNRRTEQWERDGTIVEIPLFDVSGHKVWGATAMMLAELMEIVDGD